MKKIYQTIKHDNKKTGQVGNCFQACIASLFELPAGFIKDQSPWDKQGKGMNPYMQE